MEPVEGTKQHETSLTHVKKGKNNRVFGGNLNYVRFFNKEVKDFFENRYVTNAESSYRFESSKITHKGDVIYRKDQVFENTGGTIWTGSEKELFFNCLARFSIHEIDRITEVLKTKSQAEIIVYYEVLRKELVRLKSKSKKRKKYDKLKLRKGNKEVICSQPTVSRNKGLMRYSKMPVSYEMSEEFIVMEEEQADLVSKKERTKDNDENQRFKTLFDEYIGSNRKRRRSRSTDAELEDDSVVELSASSTANESQALINVDNSHDLSKELYASNTITPLVNKKMFPKLHYKSAVLFEVLARLILAKLLSIIIESKTSQTWLRKRHIDTENDNLSLNISQSDVYGALSVIRSQQYLGILLKNSNFYKRISPLQEYFNSIPESLGVRVEGDSSISEQTVPGSRLAGLEKGSTRATDLSPPLGPFSFPDRLSNRKNIFNASSVPIPHVSSLLSRENKLSQLKSNHADDELLQEVLLDEELKKLDSNELGQSIFHEYLLLTHFCCEIRRNDHEENVTNNKEHVIDNRNNVVNEMETDRSDSEPASDIQPTSNMFAHREAESTLTNTGVTKESFSASEDIEVVEASPSSVTSLLDNFDYTFANYYEESDVL